MISFGLKCEKISEIEEFVRLVNMNVPWRIFGSRPRPAYAKSRGCMMQTVCHKGYMLEYASPNLRDDSDVVLVATRQYPQAALLGSARMMDDKDIVLGYLKSSTSRFDLVSARLRGDKDVVLRAVKHSGTNLSLVTADFSSDLDVARAMNWRGGKLGYFSDEIRDDKDIVLKSLLDGLNLEHASPRLRCDSEVVMTAVQQNSGAIQYMLFVDNTEVQKIVLEALKHDPEIKKPNSVSGYVVYESNYERCVKRTKGVFPGARFYQYAPPEVLRDKTLFLKLVSIDGLFLQYGIDAFKNEEAIVHAAVKQNFRAFQFASPKMRGLKDIAIKAIKQDGMLLEIASPELRASKDIVLMALKQNGDALAFAPEKLQTDPDVVRAARKQNKSKTPQQFPEFREYW